MEDKDRQLMVLRAWQHERLSRTHADLLRHPDYGPSCRFFLSDLYAPQDFSQRDHDIETIYQLMSRFLPNFLITLVRQAVELNDLTKSLDHTLNEAIFKELGVADIITSEIYAQGYHICNNYDKRVYQIQLLGDVGKKVALGTRIPFVGLSLRLARGPANNAGWHELQSFLERGYTAFKRMPSAQKFLSTIQRRELQILNNIFSNKEDPFNI